MEIIEKEFWTSKQRQTNSIHEISYRGCFKAELPNYFINNYSKEGDTIYDPFSGRGTTGIEACLLGRNAIFNDINPLSKIISEPRIFPVEASFILERIDKILSQNCRLEMEVDLSMFFHQKTLDEILKVRSYLLENPNLDITDKWIRLLVLSRLTGHSKGFLSVYTLPPNQAITPERQVKINEKYNNVFEYRDLKKCILQKYKILTKDIGIFEESRLNKVNKNAIFLNQDAAETPKIPSESIDLIITSPPFLDVINYKQDNWLRCFFCGINPEKIEISQIKNLEDWNAKMAKVLTEQKRILKKGKHIAFEVGEVKNGKIKLEEEVLKIAKNLGFEKIEILINKQNFSKTSNIWGVKNNEKGTNTNRILLMQK